MTRANGKLACAQEQDFDVENGTFQGDTRFELTLTALESSSGQDVGLRLRLKETDPHRLSQRQKALDKGKNTRSYQLYLQKVPRHMRGKGNKHPRTPDKHEICSAKAWLGKVRKWRLNLHDYDSEPDNGEEVIQVPSLTAQGIKPAHLYQQQCSDRKRVREDTIHPQAKRQSQAEPNTPLQETILTSAPDEDNAQPDSAAASLSGTIPKSIYDDWDESGEDIAL